MRASLILPFGKIGPKFSHLLTVRAEGADPPLAVSLTIKRPFFWTTALRSDPTIHFRSEYFGFGPK